MAPKPPIQYGDALELVATIAETDPPIWRRLRVPAALLLGELHHVLQIAFGWTDSHLHEFKVGNIGFGMIDLEEELFVVDEYAAPLGAVAAVGSKLDYCYDFGDDWRHEIRVERADYEPSCSITCLGGERACPPEDCGGVHGYSELLEVLANPKHEEHRATRTWVGRRFDPEKVDIAAVNKKLAALDKRFRRGRKRAAAMHQVALELTSKR